MEKSKFFLLYPDCIPVKGKSRSLIFNSSRNNFKFIPNDLFDILVKYNSKSIAYVKQNYENKHHGVIDEYFEFLLKEDLIFFTYNPELFPSLSLNWDDPRKINNAIIDFNANSDYDLKSIFYQLNLLGCNHIQIRFFDNVNKNILTQIHSILDNQKSGIFSIEFILPYSIDFSIKELKKIIDENARITSLIVYKAPFDKSSEILRKNFNHLLFTQLDIGSTKSCGKIHHSLFARNIKNFTESINHNSCLNKKIAIDSQGNIKNCPSMPLSFGNIKNVSLEDVLNKNDFKRYWSVTKNEIETCKDCEFRYFCTDCRAYTDRRNIDSNRDMDFSKPLKCGYNPATTKWEKWSENPLKQKAIEFYDMKEFVRQDG